MKPEKSRVKELSNIVSGKSRMQKSISIFCVDFAINLMFLNEANLKLQGKIALIHRIHNVVK